MPVDRLPQSAALRKGRISQAHGLYYVTKCLLRGPRFSEHQRTDICLALQHARANQWLSLHAFVVMPDHWHGLLNVGSDRMLPEVLQQLHRRASFPTRQRGEAIPWQSEFYDHQVRENQSVLEIAQYIENNPVRRGLAAKPCEWPWSSAHPAYVDLLDRELLGWERWQCKSE